MASCSAGALFTPGGVENPFPCHGNSLDAFSTLWGSSAPSGALAHGILPLCRSILQHHLPEIFAGGFPCVLCSCGWGGLLLCATRKEDELAFPPQPVNIYSPRQAVEMLLLSWVWCLFLLPRWNLAPESLPHWQLLFVQQWHVGVPEDRAGGASRTCQVLFASSPLALGAVRAELWGPS